MKNEAQHIDYDLLSKYFDGETTDLENESVQQWVSVSEENKAEFQRIKQAHQLTANAQLFDSDSAWDKLKSKMNAPAEEQKVVQLSSTEIKRPATFKWAVAASIVLLVGLFIGFQKPWISNKTTFAATEVATDQFALPDGSVINLNSGSSIAFEENGLKNERSVQLTGEAFFSVKRNVEKPFVISTNHSQIKVLGTSFNVKAIPGTNTDEVVVSSGKVRVTSAESGNSVELVKGQKAVVYSETGTVVKIDKAPDKDLYWKTKTIRFRNTELDSVVKILEEVFNVSITISEPSAGRTLVHSEFTNETVEYILNTIAATQRGKLTIIKTGKNTFRIDGEGDSTP